MHKYSLTRALFFIFLSTCLISGSTAVGLVYFRKWQKTRSENDTYHISTLVHTGPLKTTYLAELLDLSVDQPINLYALDLKKAAGLLLQCPIIERVELKRLPPSSMLIDYTVRKPAALLAEYENLAIDASGAIFPLHPFYTPKNLPKVILGCFEEGIPRRRIDLAIKLLLLGFAMIDTSQIDHPSVGRRQLILVDGSATLRLDPDHYEEGLRNFKRISSAAEVVDLRLSGLAYLH